MTKTSEKFLWPQENRALMRERIKKNPINARFILKRFYKFFPDLWLVLKTFLAFLGIGNFKKMELKIMYIFNGRGTHILSDKYHFLELCKKLNFSTPNQILIYGNETHDERKRRFLDKFSEDGFGFYIKPIGGYIGKGIRVLKTRDEVLNIIDEISQKSVIEDSINIDKEFRYILYKDPDGNNWHMSFEKIRFYVIGDGKSNIFNLIMKNDFIPWRRKIALFKNKYGLMKRIIPKNEKVMLENRCSYGRLPNNEEISALDNYAPILIRELEKEINHKLSIICFDLGVKKPLKKDMDFNDLNKVITPFECQLPFSPLAHFKFTPGGFWPFIDFYKMLVIDMFDPVNKRV